MTDHDVFLPFDSDAPEFARGVEVGLLWQRLQTEALPVEATVHAENAEMVLRIAEACRVDVIAVDLGGDWLSVTYS